MEQQQHIGLPPPGHVAGVGEEGYFPPPPPTSNSLPPAYGSLASVVSSGLHPQLLVLYAYFGLIAWLLHRVVFKSILAKRIRDNERKAEVALWIALAALSLGSTWTYMLRYFAHSYSQWLSKTDLTSLAIPALPVCSGGLFSPCHLSLVATRLQRWSLWLRDTSLFTESWLQVSSNAPNWWWSAEVCLFTVGVWTLFVQTQRRRLAIPHAWAYMLLGQTVAMSFAACLFNLALALRPLPEGTLLQAAEMAKYSGEQRPGLVIASEVDVAIADEEGDEDGTALNLEKTTTQTTRQHVLEAPSTHPSLGARLLVWTFTLIASFSIWHRPTSLPQVLWMHILPLALLIPNHWLNSLSEHIERLLLHPTPGSADAEGTHASNARLKSLLRPSHLFAVFAAYNFVARARQTIDVVRLVFAAVPSLELHHYGVAKIATKLLYPTSFHAHPAQSSIGSDAICLSLVAAAFIGLDAVRTATLRKEEQWAAVVLVVLTPFVGPSVTLSAWLAVRERRLEKLEKKDEERLRAEAGQGVGLFVEEVTREEVVRVRGNKDKVE